MSPLLAARHEKLPGAVEFAVQLGARQVFGEDKKGGEQPPFFIFLLENQINAR